MVVLSSIPGEWEAWSRPCGGARWPRNRNQERAGTEGKWRRGSGWGKCKFLWILRGNFKFTFSYRKWYLVTVTVLVSSTLECITIDPQSTFQFSLSGWVSTQHQCHASHSGSLLQYRYNSRPWNNKVYHAIPRNLKSKCCYCQIWSNSIKGTQTKRQRAIVGWWTKIELSDDWGKYHKYQISLKER